MTVEVAEAGPAWVGWTCPAEGKVGRVRVLEGVVIQLMFAEMLVSDSFTAVFSLAE